MEPDTAEVPTMGHVNRAKAKVLTAEDIFATDDIAREFVEIPEWGGGVWVHGMTGQEREAWEQSCRKVVKDRKGRVTHEPVLDQFRAKLIIRTVKGGDGKPIFPKGSEAKIQQKSSRALDLLFERAMSLSRIGEDDVEALAGNSETAPSDSSS